MKIGKKQVLDLLEKLYQKAGQGRQANRDAYGPSSSYVTYYAGVGDGINEAILAIEKMGEDDDNL